VFLDPVPPLVHPNDKGCSAEYLSLAVFPRGRSSKMGLGKLSISCASP
jgi:hypothetical protein